MWAEYTSYFQQQDEFSNIAVTSRDAMLNGDLPNVETPQKWVKVGRRARIVITQVSSPYKFWFLTTTAMDELKEMMKSLKWASDWIRWLWSFAIFIANKLFSVWRIAIVMWRNFWFRRIVLKLDWFVRRSSKISGIERKLLISSMTQK